jgi:hypothetical protein
LNLHLGFKIILLATFISGCCEPTVVKEYWLSDTLVIKHITDSTVIWEFNYAPIKRDSIHYIEYGSIMIKTDEPTINFGD